MIQNKLNVTLGAERIVICLECKAETIHKVLASVRQVNSQDLDESFFVETIEQFEIIECQGCKTISFRKQHQFSEDTEPNGRMKIREYYFPSRGRNNLIAKEFNNIPDKLESIYYETINAFNVGSLLLCCAGVRALVECICKDKNIEGGEVETKVGATTKKVWEKNLNGKINGLFEKGFLTKLNIEILHEHRFLGNAALHELKVPPEKELAVAINIIEHIMENIYEIPRKGEFLRSSRIKKEKS